MGTPTLREQSHCPHCRALQQDTTNSGDGDDEIGANTHERHTDGVCDTTEGCRTSVAAF